MPDTPFPLGRVHEPDARNDEYPVRLLLDHVGQTATVGSSIHRCPLHLDQGDLGSCTGHGPTHWRATTPHSESGLKEADALSLYEAATHLDSIPGSYPPDDTGSSVLAAMKALVKGRHIAGYTWATTVDEVVAALLHVGGVVVGSDWDESMFTPDEDYFISPDGNVAGGHCYLYRGVTLHGRIGARGVTDYITGRNSWRNPDGSWWGHNSDFHITLDDVQTLIDRGNAEFAIPHHVTAISAVADLRDGKEAYETP